MEVEYIFHGAKGHQASVPTKVPPRKSALTTARVVASRALAGRPSRITSGSGPGVGCVVLGPFTG